MVMSAPVFIAAKRGADIDNACAVFIAQWLDGSWHMMRDGMRAVVLESRVKGGRCVLMVAPDDTDTIEHVTVRADYYYVVETSQNG
jgi:hypothetical protein